MKHLLFVMFVVMVAWTAWAYCLMPKPDASGKKDIVWATDDNPRRPGQIGMFNDLHPEYRLRIDPINNGLDKLITQSLAGVGPDVFDGFANQVGLLYEAGLLADVTDDLARRGITLDQIWPLARPVVSIEGRMYGVPFNCGGDAIWYHKDLFDEAGVPYPPESGMTWDQFVDAAVRLTKRDANGRVIRYGIMGMLFRDVMYANGGRYFSPDGRECLLNSPQNVEALRKWLELQNKYKVMPNPAELLALSTSGGWGSGITSYFIEKRTAMGIGGRWWLCILRDVKGPHGEFPFYLGVTERPVIKTRRYIGGPRVTFVNAKSPHRDRAIEFLAFECSQQFSDQLNRDADAMPGIIARSGPGSAFYTHRPNGDRDQGDNEIWKRLMDYSITDELSPYITPVEFNTIVDAHIELTTGPRPQYTPEEALRRAADAVNERIQLNVSRTPALRERFDNGDKTPYMGNRPIEYRPDEVVPGATGVPVMSEEEAAKHHTTNRPTTGPVAVTSTAREFTSWRGRLAPDSSFALTPLKSESGTPSPQKTRSRDGDVLTEGR